ncbi:Quinone oxidoreductase [Methylacidimicrobium sp. AP8]|uniref:NADPH:quinone reductase n=1 Tax=Methylacidimicrobium sp. AP8 TaxID=2730359 RepID=UPI0018C046D2|nr:NADPH:quinone reductase [Methylacidimicrobium sp. AP8]CAB4242437.1 Quinone oxidoreductase [Methylacidimicrobium sp. AP8]
MKAIRVHEFGDPEVMRCEEVPDPEPGPGQLLLRIRAAGVNPIDAYIRAGRYGSLPPLPYTPGLDAAGVIERVGEGVSIRKAGERVYVGGSITGTYAEWALCAEKQAGLLPESISFAQGAGVYVPYVTAYRALFQKAEAMPSETVFIHGGSGAVGLAAIQLAVAAGCRVAASAGTEEGRRLARKQGAELVVDHCSEAHGAEVLAWTGGAGVAVLLEMLANVNLGRDLDLLAVGGRAVVIGSRGSVEIDPRAILSREARVLGVSLFRASDEEIATARSAVEAGLANGTLRPIVREELPLAQAPVAHRRVMEPGALGKIVLIP